MVIAIINFHRSEQLKLKEPPDIFPGSLFSKPHHNAQDLSIASAVYKGKKHQHQPESKAWSDAASSGYLSGSVAFKNKLSVQDSFDQTEEDGSSSSSDDDSDWDEDEWPAQMPLPVPLFGCERPELQFDSTDDYLQFANLVQNHVEENVSSLPYDTLSSFVL